METFSKNPKSMKIDRKSKLAAVLKYTVSDKLVDFLGDAADDGVLADYITVLVCNGKNQYQAKNDLADFLGKRTEEFVSWLWDFISNHFQEDTIPNAAVLNGKGSTESTGTSCHKSEADKDAGAELKEIQNHVNVGAAAAPFDDVDSNNPFPSKDRELPEGSKFCMGFATSVNEANAENVLAQRYENETSRSGYQAGGEQIIQYVGKCEKIVGDKSNSLSKRILRAPKKEPISRNWQSYILEESHSKHIPPINDSGRSFFPKAVNEVSHQNNMSRRSVWDRLGRPSENTPENNLTEADKVCDQHSLPLSALKNIQHKSMSGEAPVLGNFQSGLYRKSKHGVNAVDKNQVANIGRKRHFGEINSGRRTGLTCMMRGRNMDSLHEGRSQYFKKTNTVAPGPVTPAPVSASHVDMIKNGQSVQMLNVKQKLGQIEMELFKIRCKQTEIQKVAKPSSVSNYGDLKQFEVDAKSRTVLVTNVHFAATTEALSKFFSKCGVVLKVAALTGQSTSQPIGSAYVTFASKESVEKAVALSGTSFFSRTIKITPEAEVAAATSAPAQTSGSLGPQTQNFCIDRKSAFERPYPFGSRLQWRRDAVSTATERCVSVSAASEPSFPFNTPSYCDRANKDELK